jgi:hypothetical protein
MEQVRIGQFNAWRESKNFHHDLAKLTPHVDLLLLNEAARHHDSIRDWCHRHPDWEPVLPHGGFNEKQNAVIFRAALFTDFNKRPDTIKLCDGAGNRKGSHTPPRFMTRIRLAHTGGQGFQVRVTHMNSHVQKKAWRRLTRFLRYRQQVRGMVREFRRYQHSELIQLIGMDTNVDWRRTRRVPFFPYQALRRQSVLSSYDVLGRVAPGTHGSRLIDAVFVRRRHGVRFVSQKVVTGLNSDHNALVVTLQFA